jgi:hypothetical protein
MYDAGNMERAGSPDDRDADESAFGKDHIRPDILQDSPGFPVTVDDPEGVREIFDVKIPAQLTGGDAEIRDLIIGDQLLLDAVFGTEIIDFIAGFLQIREQGQVGSNMSGSTAAGQYDDLSFLCHNLNLSYGP